LHLDQIALEQQEFIMFLKMEAVEPIYRHAESSWLPLLSTRSHPSQAVFKWLKWLSREPCLDFL
jgi:hypothetical protein